MTRFLSVVRFSVLSACLFALGACNLANGQGQAQQGLPEATVSKNGLTETELTIVSGNKSHKFTVEVAKSKQEQNRGMMFRTEMAPNTGMIFPFETEKMASFWMKNTVIPLDIIFIQKDGTIESIAANATPYSLDSITSTGPVAAVLELAGGRAAEIAIRPGDQVRW